MEATRKYLKEREHAILDLLESPHKFTKKDFHDLRVELKKLSALVEMICISYPRLNRKKFFHSWRVIFKKAGKVREIQLELSVINEYSVNMKPRYYLGQLKDNLGQARISFEELREHSKVEKLKKKFNDLHVLLNGVKKENFDIYLEQKEHLIRQQVSQPQLTSDVHELRKQLKTYAYNKTIFTPSYLKNSGIKDFTDLVGRWHDLEVILDHLKLAIENKEVNAEDWDALIIIKSKLEKDCEELYSEILMEHRKLSIT